MSRLPLLPFRAMMLAWAFRLPKRRKNNDAGRCHASVFRFFSRYQGELLAAYSGAKFTATRARMSEDELIESMKDRDATVIGLDRFTEKVCAALHIGTKTRDSWAAMLRSDVHGISHPYRQEVGVFPFD